MLVIFVFVGFVMIVEMLVLVYGRCVGVVVWVVLVLISRWCVGVVLFLVILILWWHLGVNVVPVFLVRVLECCQDRMGAGVVLVPLCWWSPCWFSVCW